MSCIINISNHIVGVVSRVDTLLIYTLYFSK